MLKTRNGSYSSDYCTFGTPIIYRACGSGGTPSVDIAKNIAEALEVSLDYLVGDTTVLLKDKKMLYRIELLQKINPDYKDRILYMLDVMLKDAQNNTLQDKLA